MWLQCRRILKLEEIKMSLFSTAHQSYAELTCVLVCVCVCERRCRRHTGGWTCRTSTPPGPSTSQRRSWNQVCERISSVKDAAITKHMFEQRLAASLCVCVCACERLAGLPVHSGTGITAAIKKSDRRWDDGSINFIRLIITDGFHHVNNIFESELKTSEQI